MDQGKHYSLSVTIPYCNEEETGSHCVEWLWQISGERLTLEIIIVDDESTDNSHAIAQELAWQHPETEVISLESEQGKGTALRAGFQRALGELAVTGIVQVLFQFRVMTVLLVVVLNIGDWIFNSRVLPLSRSEKVLP